MQNDPIKEAGTKMGRCKSRSWLWVFLVSLLLLGGYWIPCSLHPSPRQKRSDSFTRSPYSAANKDKPSIVPSEFTKDRKGTFETSSPKICEHKHHLKRVERDAEGDHVLPVGNHLLVRLPEGVKDTEFATLNARWNLSKPTAMRTPRTFVVDLEEPTVKRSYLAALRRQGAHVRDYGVPVLEPWNTEGTFVGRVYLAGVKDPRDPALGLSLPSCCAGIHHSDGEAAWVHAELDKERFWKLTKQGIRVEYDQEETYAYLAPAVPIASVVANVPSTATSSPEVSARIAFGSSFRSVPELLAMVTQAANDHPGITELVDVGDSYNKTQGAGGFDMLAIRISNNAIGGTKPVFFCAAGVHGDEKPNPQLAVFFIEQLTDQYGIDPDITWLVDHHEIWVLPILNPDGYHAGTRKNGRSVDLNRNYNFKWTLNGATHGSAPESEPEIKALADLIRSRNLFQDRRGPNDADPAPLDTVGIFFDMHSPWNGNLLPWAWSSTPAPNKSSLAAISLKLKTLNGYNKSVSWNSGFGEAHGPAQDWVYGVFGVAAFTIENQSKKPSYSEVVDSYWPKAKAGLLYAAKICPQPYTLVLGPDALNLAIQNTGETIVSAFINDSANGGQRIAAAECYVETPPWAGGTSIALLASDGAFDSVVEAVSSPIDTSGLSTDQPILIYVRGKDSGGNWGPCSAVWLSTASNEAPVINAASPAPDQILPAWEMMSFAIETSDPDGEPLTYTWLLDGNQIQSGGTSLNYTPSDADVGIQSLRVDVSDGKATTFHIWTVTVIENKDILIVDDQDVNTLRTGTWKASSGANPWADGSIYSDGGGTFRWTPDLPEAGSYDVYAWWTYHGNRFNNIPYAIKHGLGADSVSVNQKDSALGGQWNLLGTYTFSAGSDGYVEVSSINGQACADAVKWVRVGSTANQPPLIESLPWADSNPVTLPATSTVQVTASDPDAGPSPLTYTWSVISGPGTVGFTPNETSSASVASASFGAAGIYVLRVIVSDGAGTVSSDVEVVVNPEFSSSEIVVDNQDANTSRIGTWQASSGPNPWADESLYSSGSGTFRWTPDLPEAGSYEVYAWWTYHSNRSNNVPFSIKHGAGADNVNVNQKDSTLGGRWNLLGTYTFSVGGDGFVEVSGINGQACADAVKFVKTGEPPPVTTNVIVDNQDTNTSRTGTWQASSGPHPWANESVYSNSGGTFRWTPNLPEAGSYDVYAWWTYHKNRGTNVPYRISHDGTIETVHVNMRDAALGGQWNLLGSYTFGAGNGGYVEVSSENGQACADAVRFVKGGGIPKSVEARSEEASPSTRKLWSVRRLRMKMNFQATARDACSMSGTVSLPNDFEWKGQRVDIEVGGLRVSFQLDAKGRGRNAHGVFRLLRRQSVWQWRAIVRGLRASAPWGEELLEERAVKPTRRSVTMVMSLGGHSFEAEHSVLWRAKAGKRGMAK